MKSCLYGTNVKPGERNDGKKNQVHKKPRHFCRGQINISKVLCGHVHFNFFLQGFKYFFDRAFAFNGSQFIKLFVVICYN